MLDTKHNDEGIYITTSLQKKKKKGSYGRVKRLKYIRLLLQPRGKKKRKKKQDPK